MLPARFAAELLVECGADVIILGLPVPDRDLAGFLTQSQPSALVVTALSVALLGRDERLFTELIRWSRGLLDARGVQALVLDESLTVIEDRLGCDFPGSLRLLAAALADS